jgi:hypothetical protein
MIPLLDVPFFSLPRTIHPNEWFEQVMPKLPLKLPPVTIPHSVTYHVIGPGGGVWSLRLVDGKIVCKTGWADTVTLQVAMTVPHLREATVGVLRERFVEFTKRAGRPVELPDLSRAPFDSARADALADVGGALALDVVDRRFSDRYRYVFTFGPGTASFETASTIVELDADELVQLVVDRGNPWQLLTGGRLRVVRGNADLPVRALQAVVARAPR